MERPKRPCSLHTRPTTSNRNRPIYYAVFRDDTGAYGSAISTGCTRKDDSVRCCESELWRRKEQRENITFAEQACGNALILDEAQSIKNPATQSFDAGKQLKSRQRITLTGTPLESSVIDLWAQFEFLEPGFPGCLRRFRKEFGSREQRSTPTRQRLRRMVQAFIPRRTKDVVERASLQRKRCACTRRWVAARNPPKKRGRSHTLDP